MHPPFEPSVTGPYPVAGDELVADTRNALRNHADVFGSDLFQARDQILSELAAIGADDDHRARLGTVKAARFEQFAALPSRQREVALALAEEAMNLLIKSTAAIIGTDSRPYPGDYVIKYKLEATVCKLHVLSAHRFKLTPIAKQKLTGDADAEFSRSFGRWLNRFGMRRRGKIEGRVA